MKKTHSHGSYRGRKLQCSVSTAYNINTLNKIVIKLHDIINMCIGRLYSFVTMPCSVIYTVQSKKIVEKNQKEDDITRLQHMHIILEQV